MIAAIVGATAGAVVGMLVASLAWVLIANRSDRGQRTGPLPLMPPSRHRLDVLEHPRRRAH
jgi:hypothetical protein